MGNFHPEAKLQILENQMKFHDLTRPRLGNGRPAWLEANSALPDLILSPTAPESSWLCEIVLSGCWRERVLQAEELREFLSDWRESPEEALAKWFKLEAPRGSAERVVLSESELITDQTAEELGL